MDVPAWMVRDLDKEAGRPGVTRQSLIKMWIAEKLGKGWSTCMPRTPTAQKVDEIQRMLDPQFKAHGFRKDRRTYRRMSEEGVWQVFNFQTTMFTQSGALDTDFTVNLGVFVAEVWDHFFWHGPVPTKPSEGDCCVGTRLGKQTPVFGDQWWRTDDQKAVADELSQHFKSYGFPFLDQFGSRDGIMDRLPSRPEL